MRITDARILGGGPPRSRRNSHPSPAPTHPDRLGFTKPLTSTLVVNHGFALTHTEGRHLPLHILFVHSQVAEVERCLQELNKMHFTVSAEIVGTPEEFSERLGSHAYDLVVAEYPSPDWRETQALELLHLSKRQIPLIFVVCGVHYKRSPHF